MAHGEPSSVWNSNGCMEAMHGTLDAGCKEQTKRRWWTAGMLAGIGEGEVGLGGRPPGELLGATRKG